MIPDAQVAVITEKPSANFNPIEVLLRLVSDVCVNRGGDDRLYARVPA